MRLRTSLIASVLMTLAACSSAPTETSPTAEATGESSAAIHGGTPDSGHANVVLVWRADLPELCSGVFLTPRIVLTANHCVDGAKAANVRVYSGEGSIPGTVGGLHPYDPGNDPDLTRHDIADIRHAPGWQLKGCPNVDDAALLVLSTPAYGNFSLYAHNAANLPKVGDTVTAVGFGDHNGTVGVKYVNTETVADIQTNVIKVGAATNVAFHGDSGGPMLRGTLNVSGIVMCHDDSGNEYYQRLDTLSSWIDGVVQELEQPCYDQCAANHASCGSTCMCLVQYDNCLTYSCGKFTPITFFCRNQFPF